MLVTNKSNQMSEKFFAPVSFDITFSGIMDCHWIVTVSTCA